MCVSACRLDIHAQCYKTVAVHNLCACTCCCCNQPKVTSVAIESPVCVPDLRAQLLLTPGDVLPAHARATHTQCQPCSHHASQNRHPTDMTETSISTRCCARCLPSCCYCCSPQGMYTPAAAHPRGCTPQLLLTPGDVYDVLLLRQACIDQVHRHSILAAQQHLTLPGGACKRVFVQWRVGRCSNVLTRKH
jgi:hypothetical protein